MEQIKRALEAAAIELGLTDFTSRFLVSEWNNIVDAWQIHSLDAYRDVPRLGRKNRLGSKQRERVWPVFARARELLQAQGVNSWPQTFAEVTAHYAEREHKPFSHIIVDEAQDLGVPELHMLAAIAGSKCGRAIFRRGSWPTHLSRALLLEGFGHRYSRAVAHTQSQLPDVASNPSNTGLATTAACARCGWE